MGATPELPIGLPTLPAGLPPVEVEEAVALAVRGRGFPTVAVPADPAFSLLAQAATAFEGVHTLGVRELRVNDAAFGIRPDEASSVEAAPFAALRATLQQWPDLVADGSVHALRVDMVGPVSLALALHSAGVPQAQALDAARTVSVLRAEALLNAVRLVEPLRPVAVVMSEPRLVGSMHPTFPLTVREVRSLLDPVVDALDRAVLDTALLIGIHVPGRSDWRTIISSGVSLVCVAPDASLLGWAPWVQALLDNGGYVAWGAVPVDRPLGTNEELLWRHLSATWRDLQAAGVDGSLLRDRSLVAPADDLARFGSEQVPHVLELLDALAARIAAPVHNRWEPALT